MIYFEDASRQQLLTIALYDNCSLSDKYEAVRELQIRQWRDDLLPRLVSLWGRGYTIFNIAIELGLTENTVKAQLYKYDLYKKRVDKCEKV